jgi:uncharacterized membrane protein YgcG
LFNISAPRHDEACLLLTAGLHALSRAFDSSKRSPLAQPQEWEFALADWLMSMPTLDVKGVGGEGLQIMRVVTSVKARCKQWVEKNAGAKVSSGGGSAGSSGGSRGSGGSSSGGSGGAGQVNLLAMD